MIYILTSKMTINTTNTKLILLNIIVKFLRYFTPSPESVEIIEKEKQLIGKDNIGNTFTAFDCWAQLHSNVSFLI